MQICLLQKKLRQQSLAIQQQKAELQCVVLELETKVCSNDIGVISEETLDVVWSAHSDIR